MRKSWDDMTHHEKFEAMREDLLRLRALQHELTSELDTAWAAMREARSEIGRMDKEVATIRALSPHLAPRKLSRIG